ncbi:SRPBCC family protein [Streptosporangium fragile]|uniref:SRPBCC family protein n=1 Tax=Streptosporangium fragile TaxID=46186 RepID=A0ABP6IAY7_9ACTN
MAEFLTDMAKLGPCVPGLENIEEIEPDRYRGTLKLHVGPIKTSFQGEVTLARGMAPGRLSASGRGRDRASGTSVQVSFTADLVETAEGSTTVTTVADVVLRGRMAQLGSGVIKATAEEVVRDFTREVNARISASVPSAGADEGRDPRAGDPTGARDGGPTPEEGTPRKLTARLLLGVALRSLWRALTRRLRRPASADHARGAR